MVVLVFGVLVFGVLDFGVLVLFPGVLLEFGVMALLAKLLVLLVAVLFGVADRGGV